ncbi:MAG TPA: nicotinate-nucleotide adenylyltransferase [Pyrinomonadaceae bacterium]|jgi:nicotinate-nucleotide adenylyltransferase|nr:nicotinate-nucleotide adenylyltransferase [Pyrinomonadaceae bacterium]
MKRIAFYGGSFDPLHKGHLTIAHVLSEIFKLDEFVFIPAFHAPHKKEKKPTSAFHRFAMLALATNDQPHIKVSKMELDVPERPYSVETLTRLKNELIDTQIFFVMGADSWAEITTWREWETVLTLVNIIVVTRPDYEIGFAHVTDEIRERIIDLRKPKPENQSEIQNPKSKIYITDSVQIDVSATEIRQKIKEKTNDWHEDVPQAVAKYIEKYELYK